jgi:hypothetical protein
VVIEVPQYQLYHILVKEVIRVFLVVGVEMVRVSLRVSLGVKMVKVSLGVEMMLVVEMVRVSLGVEMVRESPEVEVVWGFLGSEARGAQEGFLGVEVVRESEVLGAQAMGS